MFHKNKDKSDGRYSWCRECYNDAKRNSIHHRVNNLFHQAKYRARVKGLPFSLTKERILKALEEGRCEATGIPFSPPGIDPRGPFTPSVDRKVPSLGYTDDNVQIVVRIHNFARGSWGDDILNVYIKHMARRAEEG